jgi:hypothetical protein
MLDGNLGTWFGDNMTEEQKQKAKELHKSIKGSMQARQILREDVRFAERQLEQHKTSHEQTCRRSLIRCVCAIVEGTLSLMKAATLPAANFFGIRLSTKEIELATGRRAKTGKPIPFLPFQENVKETLKIFMKAHGVQIAIDYDDSRFKDLCEMFGLRNKLMHPKTLFDIEVSDLAFKTSIRGSNWFDSIGVTIMEHSKEKMASASASF